MSSPRPDESGEQWGTNRVVVREADPWQRACLFQVVTAGESALMCCARGAGKSETIAVAAYAEACLGGFAVVLSRSDRQALRIMRKCNTYHHRHRVLPGERTTMHEMELANGGRISALPCSADTVIGEHGVTLLIIDEAARIPDDFYALVTPMTTVSRGRVVLLSTPCGKRGFFYREWIGEGDRDWHRYRYPWSMCPRITQEHVERERRRHGDWWVEQEYECRFKGEASSYFNLDQYCKLVEN